MEISEVRIRLMGRDVPGGAGRVLAFCTLVIDGMLVIRDIRVIKGEAEAFLAMPDKKVAAACHQCGGRAPLIDRFCGRCGCRLAEGRAWPGPASPSGRPKYHADVVFPAHAPARAFIHDAVLAAYAAELAASREPGYVCRYDEPAGRRAGMGEGVVA